MSITVLVMTDGRTDYLTQTVASMAFLHGPVTRRVLHDDTGDTGHHERLRALFPDWELVTTPGRSGFGGAYRHAYDRILAHDDNPWLWSTEDDFTFIRDVDLAAMADVLDHHPYLSQLALRRQPWNDVERAAGGIVESRPRDYSDHIDTHGRQWLEHRVFHTTNPSLVPRRVLQAHRWPTVPHSEGVFSAAVFADPHARSGYWGSRASGEWCHHIGDVRAGHGY